MFDNMQLLDDKTKLPMFYQSFRDEEGRTYRIHAYVTFNKACPCNCSFCRNEQFSKEIKSNNTENMWKALDTFSPYIHSITFGGGEPLWFIKDLFKMMDRVSTLDDVRRTYMITSGLRRPFLRNKKKIFSHFDKIYLTRQRYSDEDNQKAFNTKVPILTTKDLRHLGYYTSSRIEVVSTCYKGGLDSVQEMIQLIKWTAYIGSETIIFNDLQCDVTNANYYKEHQIDDDIFESVICYLLGEGFSEKIEVCFSGGYTIRMYSGNLMSNNTLDRDFWYINVGFKQYHKPGTTHEIWKRSSKRTFDLSIMPNGEVFTDWANTQSANNI